jgi:predicted MFS family arabinose efflux permease
MGDATVPPSPSGPTPGTLTTLRAVLGNPQLRRVQLAFLGSAVGDWAYATAIVVWAYAVGGAAAVGVWMGVRLVLTAVTAPLAAVLADRWSRRRVMLLSDGLRAAAVAAAGVLIALDAAPAVVFALATLVALLTTPFLVAQRSLLPSLARTPVELTGANGVASTIESLAVFAGPALAGGLLLVADVPTVLAVNVATFVWSLVMVARVDAPRRAARGSRPPGEADESLLVETLAGFRVLAGDRRLLLVVGQTSLQTMVRGASVVFLVVMADQVLGSPDAGLGLLNAVLGVGSVLGGTVAIMRATRGTLGRDLTVGVVLWSAPLLLVTVSPTIAACLVVAALIGLANPLVDVSLDTILQRLVPDAVLARVFGAVEACVVAAAALGALLMPPLLDRWGLGTALAVLAAPVAATALLGLPATTRLDAQLRAPRGLALVRGADIFAPLDPTTVEQLAHRLTEVRLDPGEVLIREGAHSDCFYLVEAGRVVVSQDGRTLRREGPGEYVGEIGLLRDVPRTATVTAEEEAVVLSLSRDDFLAAVTGHAESHRAADAVVGLRLAG